MSDSTRKAIGGRFEVAARDTRRQAFRSADGGSSASVDFSSTVDRHLRRVPVPLRAQADYSPEMMGRYINGLEERLAEHIRKHSPRWLADETRNILQRWNAPGAHHPTPSWATPRDVLGEARTYAAMLLQDRLLAKMDRMNGIRWSHNLRVDERRDPLQGIFRSQTKDQPKYKLKQKL